MLANTLPFWLKYPIDDEREGLILNARILWAFSESANCGYFGIYERDLRVRRRSWDF